MNFCRSTLALALAGAAGAALAQQIPLRSDATSATYERLRARVLTVPSMAPQQRTRTDPVIARAAPGSHDCTMNVGPQDTADAGNALGPTATRKGYASLDSTTLIEAPLICVSR